MLKPKTFSYRRHWEQVSDEDLLNTELVTDDPETLENLVGEIPSGDQESYVEFKYDLRGSGREMLHCVHGNHAHLSGFVFRKGDVRFLVGRICGKSIYGEDFDQYEADFNAVIDRKAKLERIQELTHAIGPFREWLEEVAASPAFSGYSRVRGQLREQMPWVSDMLAAIALANNRPGLNIPSALCDDDDDARKDFHKLMTDFASASLLLVGDLEQVSKKIVAIRARLDAVAKGVDEVLKQLKEVEDFFQPSVLSLICVLANENDNPKKRKYESGLLSITCKRGRDKVVIKMPQNFILPDRRPIDKFRAVLFGDAN